MLHSTFISIFKWKEEVCPGRGSKFFQTSVNQFFFCHSGEDQNVFLGSALPLTLTSMWTFYLKISLSRVRVLLWQHPHLRLKQPKVFTTSTGFIFRFYGLGEFWRSSYFLFLHLFEKLVSVGIQGIFIILSVEVLFIQSVQNRSAEFNLSQPPE